MARTIESETLETGLYVDSGRMTADDALREVIRLAETLAGFPVDPWDRALVDDDGWTEPETNGTETLIEISDSAIDWLNRCTEPGPDDDGNPYPIWAWDADAGGFGVWYSDPETFDWLGSCSECWTGETTRRVDCGMFGIKDFCNSCYREHVSPSHRVMWTPTPIRVRNVDSWRYAILTVDVRIEPVVDETDGTVEMMPTIPRPFVWLLSARDEPELTDPWVMTEAPNYVEPDEYDPEYHFGPHPGFQPDDDGTDRMIVSVKYVGVLDSNQFDRFADRMLIGESEPEPTMGMITGIVDMWNIPAGSFTWDGMEWNVGGWTPFDYVNLYVSPGLPRYVDGSDLIESARATQRHYEPATNPI